jgi:hypothetical protein
MDPVVARKTWRTLEPVHAMIYFAPEADEHYRRAGVTDQRSGYFGSRSAALGEATAELVIATFFNFDPGTVRAAMAGLWDATTPDALLAARLAAADEALRRLLGDAAAGPGVEEAAVLARQAAHAACDRLEGRPLFAAHAGLDWPDDPLLVLWHAQTLLREFRGDGHIAALVAAGVSGIEALITHGGSGEIAAAVLRSSRNWSDRAWTVAADGLVDRGWLDGFGSLTEAGAEHRRSVEDRTDELALAPYAAIGEEACARLRELVRPLSRAIVSNGGLPV